MNLLIHNALIALDVIANIRLEIVILLDNLLIYNLIVELVLLIIVTLLNYILRFLVHPYIIINTFNFLIINKLVFHLTWFLSLKKGIIF